MARIRTYPDDALVAQGLVAQGLVAQGLVAQGLVAQGLVAQGLVAQGLVAQGRRAGPRRAGPRKERRTLPGNRRKRPEHFEVLRAALDGFERRHDLALGHVSADFDVEHVVPAFTGDGP